MHWIFHQKRIPEDGQSGANRGAYRSPRVDALLDRGQGEVDVEARKKTYAEVQRILAEDLPYVFLWHEDNIAVVRKELTGVELMPNAKFDLLRLIGKDAAAPAGSAP